MVSDPGQPVLVAELRTSPLLCPPEGGVQEMAQEVTTRKTAALPECWAGREHGDGRGQR